MTQSRKTTEKTTESTEHRPSGQPEGNSGYKIAARQPNHGCWHLPECLSHLVSPSLWLAVACWGLQRGVPVTRDDIARAFRISPRRAADVMTYITDDRSDVVKVEKKIERVGSGHRQLRFHVLKVMMSAVTARDEKKRKASVERRRDAGPAAGREKEAEFMAQARDLFFGRRQVKGKG